MLNLKKIQEENLNKPTKALDKIKCRRYEETERRGI